MEENEIRRANRAALPKLLLFMVLCLAVGGTAGYFAARYGLNTLTGNLKSAGAFFGSNVAPYLLLAVAVLSPAVCFSIYRGAKKRIAAWDGEDEAVYEAIDRRLSTVNRISASALVLSYFLLAASYSGGFGIFESRRLTVLYFLAIAAFFAVIIETLLLGQRCVDAVKRVNPEKKASFYDMNFQKKWMEDCDEAEKLLIGRCAYRAYRATNRVCAILAGVCALGALLFDIGFLPSLAVCSIWIVSQSAYCREAMKYAKLGNRLS
ncbi:MAG TPA: DUF3169 domain-containing protein [Clostridiales bacterium]|nr:DUF3169 domain-containing protein [Clostridiales bacterium]